MGRLTTHGAWLKKIWHRPGRLRPGGRWGTGRIRRCRCAPQRVGWGSAGRVSTTDPAPLHPATAALDHRVDTIYTATPFYGSRRLAVVLRQEGYAVSRQRVPHAMWTRGIPGLAPGTATRRPHPAPAVYPYLLRGVTAAYPTVTSK